MWWDYLKLEDSEERVVYIYGREAIGLDGEIVYDRKKRRWSVTIPCKKDAGNPNNIAETERKSWQVVKAGFPPSLHVAIW